MSKAFYDALGITYRAEYDLHDMDIPTDAASDKHGWRNPHYGLKHSGESRKLISEARKGVNTNTPEGIAKKREAWLRNNPNTYLKDKMAENRAKKYVVKMPSGETLVVKNMAKFCRDNNLHKGNMCSVAKGILKQYKGWTCSYLTA